MVHSVKVLDRLACIQGYLKVAVQVMQEEKRSSSTPSPVEFRESGAEEVSFFFYIEYGSSENK